MKHHMSCVLAAAMLAALFVCPVWVVAEAGPVKCLWVGLAPHGAPVMQEVVDDIEAKFPDVDITVTEDIEDLKIDNLKKYDVLLLLQLKAEKGDPPDEVKQGITDFLKGGGGLVVIHYAAANCQAWRDSIDIFGAMWVNGKSTHGPYHEFRVDVTDEAHPIVEGVKSFVTNDELYFNLLMRPDMHIIMTADEERFGQTVAEPMLATHLVYDARCVYFALGHDPKSTQPPEFRKIIAQSIEWTAGRR